MLRFILRSVGAAWGERRQLATDKRGVSALEFAIISPVMLAIGLGMMKFGVAMSHYLMLSNAAAQGATTFAFARGTATPYATTSTAINNAAPGLTAASITKTLRVNGGTACTTDTACKDALGTAAGATAQVTVSYPCDLSVMGINYKPSCTLSATSSQMVQ